MADCRKIFILCFFITLKITALGQTDHEFWFAAPAITFQTIAPSPYLFDHLNQPVALYFTTATGPAHVKIEQPANPSFVPINVTVLNSTAAEAVLTPFIEQIENKPANAILNYGLRITSDVAVTATYDIQSPYNSATYTLDGRNALGTEFLIPSQFHFNNYPNTDPPARNVFDIVATEDSTLVTIVPSHAITGHPANITFTVMLNRGQTWSGRAVSNDSTQHLGGTFIYANNPIAVTITDDAVIFPNNSPAQLDVAGDQLIPRQLAATDFVIPDVNGLGQSPGTRLIVYSFEDNTTVICRDTVHTYTKIVDRGKYAEFSSQYDSLGYFYTASSVIHADKPVIVYYFMGTGGFGGASQANACMVPPMRCGGSKRVTFTRSPPNGVWNWFDISVVIQNGYQQFITGISVSNWTIVPATNGEYVKATISYAIGANATVTITNPMQGFQVSALSSDWPQPTNQYSKYSYFSNFSALYLGPDRHTCPGDSILLDAGYGRDSYLWNTGQNNQMIWVTNPGTYWVTVGQDDCTLSDTIVLSNYWSQPIDLGPDHQICAGDSILLDAGAGRAWYAWSNGATTQSIWVKNSGEYSVTAPDVHCDVSDTIIVTTTPPPAITNSPTASTICSGEHTDIQVLSTVNGTLFHWTAICSIGNVTGFSPDSGLVISQVLVNNLATPGEVIYHVVPKIGDCAGQAVDFPVTVNPGDAVSVSINASANSVCAGAMVSFTAIPANQGTTPTYQWYVNGTISGTNSPTFSYVPQNGDQVSCTLTSSNTACISNNPATSNTVTIIVNPVLPVSISVLPSANPICFGTLINFTATSVNGGFAPQYQWAVNGMNVGSNTQIYTYVPLNGDEITCTLTSDGTCLSGNPAISNTVVMAVNPLLPVSVSISASNNPFCSGNSVTYTATQVNGGNTPAYTWYVNGVLSGANNPIFSYNPVNGDVVTCSLASSETCITGNPAMSNAITMVVNTNLPAGITIAASVNPFCPGTQVTFTATPGNGGTTPTFQWIVNGMNTGTNSPSFIYSPASNDSVRCVMTSNLNCVTGSPVSSLKVIMVGLPVPDVSFSACFDTITTITAKPFRLKGGIPLGGTYTGPGVNSLTSIFTPSMAGTGLKTIQYTYTNVASCSAGKSKTILVQPNPVFSCGNSFIDIRDGKSYPTVQIGTQCWMKENLDFGLGISDFSLQTDNCISEKYIHASSFYQWDELMHYDPAIASQGLCPPGWHVPTSGEWDVLISVNSGPGQAGGYLIDTQMPSGFQSHQQGIFYLNNTWAFTTGIYAGSMYWTSTASGTEKAIARGLNESNLSVSRYEAARANAYSVRCIQD